MERSTDQRRGAHDLAGAAGIERVEPEMHAVRARRDGDVGAPIHDHAQAGGLFGAREASRLVPAGDERSSDLEERRIGEGAIPQLDPVGARGEEGARTFSRSLAESVRVQHDAEQRRAFEERQPAAQKLAVPSSGLEAEA